jgi:TonB-dependent starch-binding outer membrane protein SusC
MKKKKCFPLSGKKIRIELLIMRFIVFFLVLGTQQIAAGNAISQNRIVSLNYERVTFEQLIWDIQKQTDIVFIYGSDIIRGIEKKDVHFSDADAVDVLRDFIKGTDVSMEIVDDVIVLKKREILPVVIDQPTHEVSGRVTDEEGLPLPGASVIVKGTMRGVTTNNEGVYTLAGVDENAVLVISYLGFKTREIAIEGKSIINIVLEEDITRLGEVLVVSTGYQQIPRERISGSFEVIDGSILQERATADLASSLEGLALGFQRIIRTNLDGSISYDNRIRGQGTLTASIANPLIVVDGFPVEDADFATINPNNIESVTILKDAAAASIWGARAANGVIVVTTKMGKGIDQFEVSANAFMRVGSMLDLDYINPIANSETHIAWDKYVYDHGLTGNLTPSALGEVLNSLSPGLTLYNEYVLGNITEAEYNSQIAQLMQYNYQDDVYKHLLQNNVYQQFNVAVNGSTSRNNYSFSGMFDRSNSHYVGDASQKALINFRNNFRMNNWLRLDVGATIGLHSITNEGASLSDIRRLHPYQRLLDDEGEYVSMVRDYYLPIQEGVSERGNFPYSDWTYNLLQELRSSERTAQNNTARLQAGVNVNIIKGLTWNGKVQFERIENKTQDIFSEESYLVRNQVNRYNAFDNNTGQVTVNSADGLAYPKGSALDRSTTQHQSYVFRNQFLLDRSFGDRHHVMALVGSEFSSYVSDFKQNVRVWGYDHDRLLFPTQPFYDKFGARQFHLTSSTRLTPGKGWQSSYTDNRFFSLYGNFSYTYNWKYTLTGSVRTDASNMIVKDPKYRYAPFWSLGGRWAIDREEFLENVNWVDRLQIRGSYGVLGNVVTSTSVVPLISYFASPNSNTQQYSARIMDFGNPLLRWEKTAIINAGIDYGFFKNKLYGKVDVYSKHSKDVLASIDIAGAYGMGYSNAVNAAEMLNQGIEVEIATAQDITSNLKWRGRLMVSRNRNEIKKLDVFGYFAARLEYETVFVQGKPLSPVYSYIYEGEVDGIPMIRFENDMLTEIFNIPSISDARNFMQFDGSLIPTTELGFVTDFEFKGFGLKAMLLGRFGHVFRADAPGYPLLNNSAMSVLRQPMEDVVNGLSDKFPGLPPTYITSLSAYNLVRSFDSLVEDASNIRIQEVTLSYTIPKRFIQNWNISNIRLYCQANNLGILWKATDTYYDPDFKHFRMPVSYMFGLNVTF